MLSRVAENLYWMMRCLERAENGACLINAATQLLLDLPRGASFGWNDMLKVTGLKREIQVRYAGHHEASIMTVLVSDEHNPDRSYRASVLCVKTAARCAKCCCGWHGNVSRPCIC